MKPILAVLACNANKDNEPLDTMAPTDSDIPSDDSGVTSGPLPVVVAADDVESRTYYGTPGSFFGAAMVYGPILQDGAPGLVVSAPTTNMFSSRGTPTTTSFVYIFADAFTANVDNPGSTDDAVVKISGNDVPDRFGYSLALYSHRNGTTRLAVGAPQTSEGGRVYLFSGQFAPGTYAVDTEESQQDAGVTTVFDASLTGSLDPNIDSMWFGSNIAAGDFFASVPGDELVIAADQWTPFDDNPSNMGGAVIVAPNKPISKVVVQPSQGVGSFGFHVRAGDVNADGSADVIASAPTTNFTDNALSLQGAVLVFYGPFTPGTTEYSDYSERYMIGISSNEFFTSDILGKGMSNPWDFDGDGHTDFLVTAGDSPLDEYGDQATGQSVTFVSGAALDDYEDPTTTIIELREENASAVDDNLGDYQPYIGEINGESWVVIPQPKNDRTYFFRGTDFANETEQTLVAHEDHHGASYVLEMASETILNIRDTDGNGYDELALSQSEANCEDGSENCGKVTIVDTNFLQ